MEISKQESYEGAGKSATYEWEKEKSQYRKAATNCQREKSERMLSKKSAVD